MGIKKEALPGIFNAFEQDKTAKNRHIAGTGLGLPISKAFVEMMGGSIILDSEYEQGTIITVIIPLVLGSESEVSYENKTETKLDIYAPNANILLVDDNEFNLKVACGLLKLYGIEAKKALSGREAIDLVKENDFDIVFMDHMMPEMDGVEAAAEIRKLGEQYKSLPIIALTANAVQGAKEMFLLNDFNDFISKPIDIQKMLEILINWLPKEKVTQIKKSDDSEQSKNLNAKKSLGGENNVSSPPIAILLNKLSEIEGLDVNSGLSYIGQNKENYIGLLEFFSENCKTYIDELKNTWNEEDWEHYAIKVHALKGVLANLGAEALSKWAAKLETASKSMNEKSNVKDENISDAKAVCRNETGTFCESLAHFHEKLSLILTENSNSGINETVKTNQVAVSGTTQIFFEQLRLLNTACVDYSFTETKKIFSVLDEYEWDDDTKTKLNDLRKIIASFEYEKAQEIINKIVDKSLKGEENV